METLGHILHSVGETVGLVSRDEKKEDAPAAAPSGSAGAAPAKSSAAYPEWERQQQAHKEGGILHSIADAARNALAPPPLDADPVEEVVVPVKPPGTTLPEEKKPEESAAKEEDKPSTFLGGLLQKVEHKIEQALPLVAPHHDDKSATDTAPKPVEVSVSALGPVWEKDEAEEKAGEMNTGKLESAEEKHGPASETRDTAMEPLAPVGGDKKAKADFEPARQSIPMSAGFQPQWSSVNFTPARKGDVMFVQANPNLTAEFRIHPVNKIESPSERRSEIGDWEYEGGHVRQETSYKGSMDESTAEAKREAIGVSDEELERVAEAADRVMAQNAEDRRTSISALQEKKDEFPERELKVEFAPAPMHGGFALEPPSETIAAGTEVALEEASAKADESTPLLHPDANKGLSPDDFADIAPEGQLIGAEGEKEEKKAEAVSEAPVQQSRSHEGYERIKDREEEMPRGADEKVDTDTATATFKPSSVTQPISVDSQIKTEDVTDATGDENAKDTDAPASSLAPTAASKQVSVGTLINMIAKIDESKLPPLTADIAFAAPAALHEPTHHEYHPKHSHNDRLPGRAEHHVNQPRHQA